MKKIQIGLIIAMLLVFNAQVVADGSLSAFLKVGVMATGLNESAQKIKATLSNGENDFGYTAFEILGEYSPAQNPDFIVIAFTRADLREVTENIGERAVMASILKLSLNKTQTGETEICLLNPEYLFYAYLRESMDEYEADLNTIAMEVKLALQSIVENAQFLPFGGNSSTDELKEYRFMVRFPSFDEPVEIETFTSFEQGVATIRKNLKAKRGGTVKVYETVSEGKKLAVFGIGLLDLRGGESKFLPEIGFNNIAAMPYELVLVDNKATILHGKYRFPLFWSNLTMADLNELRSTPKNIETTMKDLTK